MSVFVIIAAVVFVDVVDHVAVVCFDVVSHVCVIFRFFLRILISTFG